jgi:hypothetical protein
MVRGWEECDINGWEEQISASFSSAQEPLLLNDIAELPGKCGLNSSNSSFTRSAQASHNQHRQKKDKFPSTNRKKEYIPHISQSTKRKEYVSSCALSPTPPPLQISFTPCDH